jgi:hypothetical protein
MLDLFYKKGAYAALRALGFKTAAAEEYDEEEQGTPFPEKSLNINAERLAQRLRDEDEGEHEQIAPENASYTWDRPVTWQSPINVSGFESGGGVGGLHLPGSPRS